MKKFKINEQNIHDILRPKSQEEIYQAATSIKDPQELLRISVNKLGDPKLVQLAIDRGADPNTISDVIKVNSPEIINILLSNARSVAPNSLVYKALKMGLEDKIIELIENNKLNPGHKNSILFVWAVGFGREQLVDLLLEDPRINLETEKESIAEALSIAIAKGNNELVTKILSDERVDPSGDYNRPINTAAQFGNKDVFELLINHPRINLDEKILEEIMNFAKENNNKDIINIIKNRMKKIVRESLVAAEPQREVKPSTPEVEPAVKPGRPGVKPGRRHPSPIKRERPSVDPRPKASADDVAEKFLDLVKEE
jgi:hypothetical protein